MLRTWLLPVAILATSFTQLRATPHRILDPCPTGTLADYLSLPEAGCLIGHLGYSDFAFAVLEATNITPAGPSEIFVAPTFEGPRAALNIASPAFSVTGDQSVAYLIEYLVDPHPEIFEVDMEMSTETPVAPGEAIVNGHLCIGGEFLGLVGSLDCTGREETLQVFHRGGTNFDLFDSISFPLTAIVDIQLEIILNANGASADFTSLSSGAHSIAGVPEPAAWLLVLPGLVAVGFRRYRQSR